MNYMGFYTGGEHLTNDIGDSPCQVLDIPYDAFCVTIQQLWYAMHRHGYTGRNHITGENGSSITKTGGLGYKYAGAKRSAVLYWEKYCYIYVVDRDV